ncbi:hypothetical protein ACFVW2_21690 [Streptomyces sp. NPDC058171]
MARQSMKRAMLAALTTAALVGLLAPNASAAEPEPLTRTWKAVVQCQLVRIDPYGVQGYITGSGTGTTQESAVTNAKQHADTKVPVGHYKRHCKTVQLGRASAPAITPVVLAA